MVVRGFAVHLRVLLTLLPVGGCVFLISPDSIGDHCGFKGATGCATCIREKCQDPVDACCKDSTCSGSYSSAFLDTVDKCGQGQTGDCAKGLTSTQYGPAETIRKCVVQQCNEQCTSGAVAAEWSCAVAREKKNDCATCVYDACSSALDQCCGDSSCSKSTDVQRDIGGCVAGDAKACAYMTSKSESGVEGVVRACIQKSCGAACIGTARPHASCTLLSGGTHCTCTPAETSKGPDCSVAAVGGGRCVLGSTGCECGAFACSTGSSCSCSFGSSGSAQTCAPPGGSGSCCVSLSTSGVSCACSSSSSCSGARVASCDQSTVLGALADTGRLVDACSN